jgi:hypothetical protein
MVRQVPQNGNFMPIPFALANLAFYDYVMLMEPVYHGLPFKRIRFTEDREKIGEIFDGEVEYSWDVQTGSNTLDGQQQEFTLPTFSMMGGKKKQLLPANVENAVTRYTKSESDEPVEYKMLGWDGKQFNGLEIETAELKFMVPAWYPAMAMTFPFIRRLMGFVGAINSKSFYGLEPGECKYLGPEQSWVTRTVATGIPNMPTQLIRTVELQHQFQAQLSLTDVEIGEMTIPNIRGWDYVDIHYENSMVDIGDGKKVPLATPQQVDVVKVHKEKDLWELLDGRILM